jgi:hypothetical protein
MDHRPSDLTLLPLAKFLLAGCMVQFQMEADLPHAAAVTLTKLSLRRQATKIYPLPHRFDLVNSDSVHTGS